jgi:hypothetical protein
MRKSLVLALVCSLICVSGVARAEFYTGNNLKGMLEQWDKGTSNVEAWLGAGYVLGVHDTLSGIAVCSGTNVSPRDLINTTLQYMRSNPEALNQTGDRVVAVSLKSVWPCAKDSGFAKFWRGNDLQPKLDKWDKQTYQDQNAQIAAGYLDGVSDAASGVILCAPDGVTNGQLTSITLKVMRQNPEILDWWADKIILKSLTPLWPCKHSAETSTPTQAATPVRKPARPKLPAQADSPF